MDEVMQWYERDMTLEQAMDGIETNMRSSVRNYIAVGFYLKAIRDRKLFQEAGYKNFEEFVRDKYDRDKGWASRCIKVNDQRAAFVDAYETWPLWIETKQTGERYYRYDLEDGTSMVVKVYHARIFDGYASGSYEAKYHDGYGRHEYYLLRDGKFFRDCDTNRGLLIEKLKEIQKKGKVIAWPGRMNRCRKSDCKNCHCYY